MRNECKHVYIHSCLSIRDGNYGSLKWSDSFRSGQQKDPVQRPVCDLIVYFEPIESCNSQNGSLRIVFETVRVYDSDFGQMGHEFTT